MAAEIKRRRGTATELQGFTPAIAEIIVNTTDNTLHVGDGATVGGHKQGSRADLVRNTDGKSAQDTHDAIKAMLVAQGRSGDFGFFKEGFDYGNVGDVGIDTDGKIYTYVGAAALPVTVSAGTNPVGGGEYQLLESKYRETSLPEAIKESVEMGYVYTLTDIGYTRVRVVSSSESLGKFVGTQPNGNKLKVLEASPIDGDFVTEITVGAGGDFETLNDALLFSLDIVNKYTDSINIKLLSGFVLSEQIDFNNKSFNNVVISSEDVSVTVSREALTAKVGRWYSAFRFFKCIAPTINTVFDMDATGTTTSRIHLYLIMAEIHINPSCGFINGAERNVDCTQASLVVAPSAVFTGAGGVGFRPSTASRVFLQYADVSGSAYGLSGGSGANISAANIVAENCTTTSISGQDAVTMEINNASLSSDGLVISASQVCIINAVGSVISAKAGCALVSNGATLNLDGATISSTTGAGNGLQAEDGGYISAARASVNGFSINAFTRRGGRVVTDLGDFNDASTHCLFSTDGGYISAAYTKARKNSTTDSASDIAVLKCGEIVALSTVGGFSKTPNVLDENGVIKSLSKIRNRGFATVANGTTSVVVGHGLDIPPTLSEINVTPRSSMGNASKFWIENITSTTFTIFVNSDPVTPVGAGFVWKAEKLV